MVIPYLLKTIIIIILTNIDRIDWYCHQIIIQDLTMVPANLPFTIDNRLLLIKTERNKFYTINYAWSGKNTNLKAVSNEKNILYKGTIDMGRE